MKKIRDMLAAFSEIIELIVAAVVAIAIVVAIIGFIPQIAIFWAERGATIDGLSNIMSRLLTIVIGSELIRMLLQPNPETVTEVLVFLIARHMIVHDTTPLENLISVISIAILYIVRHLLISDAKRDADRTRFDRLTRFFKDTTKVFGGRAPEEQTPEEAAHDE